MGAVADSLLYHFVLCTVKGSLIRLPIIDGYWWKHPSSKSTLCNIASYNRSRNFSTHAFILSNALHRL